MQEIRGQSDGPKPFEVSRSPHRLRDHGMEIDHLKAGPQKLLKQLLRWLIRNASRAQESLLLVRLVP